VVALVVADISVQLFLLLVLVINDAWSSCSSSTRR